MTLTPQPYDALLLMPWRYSVNVRNPSTGEQRTVLVRLDSNEEVDALWALLTNWPDSSHSESVAGYYASVRALEGLGDNWAVEPSEITRIRHLH